MASNPKQGGGFTTFVVPLLVLTCLLWVSQAQRDTSVREPPRILEPVKFRNIFKPKGSNILLQCSATGKPKPTLRWYMDDLEISQTRKDMTYDAIKGTLLIRNLSMSQEAFYHCQAKNVFPNGKSAVAISAKVQVIMARLDDWVITDKDTIKEDLYRGAYGKLRCDDDRPAFQGQTSFMWMKVDSERQVALPSDPRRFIDNEGTLHFTSVEEKDRLGGAYYACALSNNDDGHIKRGRKRIVTLLDSDDGVGDKPILRVPTGESSETVNVNKTAHLECFFSGPNVPEISWEKNGEPISDGGRYKFEQSRRVLKIKNVEQSDETEYQCIGTLANGQKAEGKIFINVTSAPMWKHGLESQTIPQGQNATFFCDAHSALGEEPPNTPLWYKNGLLLKSFSKEKYDFQQSGKKMVVMKVQKDDDIACFRCTVRNSVDMSVSDACLNVILPITVETRPKEKQAVKKGEMVNLTVIATADPLVTLSYTWTFKGQKYTKLPPHVEYDDFTKQTFINTANFTEEQMEEIAGEYHLRLHHPYEEKFLTMEVVAEDDEPIVVPVTEAGFDYWIIGLIIGILLIIIVILIICCVICRRKMLEGDYPVDRKETAAGLDPEKELKDSGFHDLSRADYDYLPEKKSPNMDFDENIPLGDDESFGSAEYGEEATAFNEDGSFIGVYSKDKKGGPPGYQAAESNV